IDLARRVEGEESIGAGASRPIADVAARLRVPAVEVRRAAIRREISGTAGAGLPHARRLVPVQIHDAVFVRHREVGRTARDLGDLVLQRADEVILVVAGNSGRAVAPGAADLL